MSKDHERILANKSLGLRNQSDWKLCWGQNSDPCLITFTSSVRIWSFFVTKEDHTIKALEPNYLFLSQARRPPQTLVKSGGRI